MRKVLFSVIVLNVCLLAGIQAFSQEATAGNNLAVVSWEETTHEFGDVALNQPATHEFQFKNTSSVPLIISNVKASCGCTATNYPKSPVAPGGSASITATYNAKKAGTFTKTLTVYTNTEKSVQVLTIKGVVK